MHLPPYLPVALGFAPPSSHLFLVLRVWQVSLWKESATGEWLRVGQLSEDSTPEAA